MTYARRVDRNHGEIVDALRKCGWAVWDTSRLGGGVDAVAARAGRVVLCEIKAAGGKLSASQVDFLAAWPGEHAVLRSVEDVLRMSQ